MRIKRIDGDATYTKDGTIVFWIERDGIETPVQISGKALVDNFGAASDKEEDLLSAFNTNQDRIFAAAERAARQGTPTHRIVLNPDNSN